MAFTQCPNRVVSSQHHLDTKNGYRSRARSPSLPIAPLKSIHFLEQAVNLDHFLRSSLSLEQRSGLFKFSDRLIPFTLAIKGSPDRKMRLCKIRVQAQGLPRLS